jgi:AraC-like DNA-binding protein
MGRSIVKTGMMSSPATVGSLQVEHLLAALERRGIRRSAICRAVGIAAGPLRDQDARVTASVFVALLAEAERLTGDRLIGLHAGEVAEARGPLFYLLLSHPWLEVGLQQVERFGAAALDTLQIRLTRHARTVSVVVDLGAEFENAPHMLDYVFATAATTFRRVLGVGSLLQEAHVRHGPWADTVEAERVLGCRVKYGQPENRLVFASRILESASPFGSQLAAAAIVKFIESLRREVPLPATFRGRVEVITRRMLARGVRADRAAVARELHVSDRTLRARLQDEGTTFRAVRDGVLWEVVDTLLANPNLTVEAVALSVGFGDVAAFSNAFKRRAGCSPTTYRERVAGRSDPIRR